MRKVTTKVDRTLSFMTKLNKCLFRVNQLPRLPSLLDSASCPKLVTTEEISLLSSPDL